MPTVTRLSIVPVKGLALQHPDEVVLERHGVTANRRFYLVDAAGLRYAAKESGALALVAADYDPEDERLALRFPDGRTVEGRVHVGAEEVVLDLYGRPVPGRVVEGPWADALGEYAGQALRLVRADEPGAALDRGDGPFSLVSEASLAELGRHAGTARPVDGRRFRMLVQVDGCGPHEEDDWVGARLRVGEATVDVVDTVGRCVVTSRNPATGERDLDTLAAIASYRGRNAVTGAIDFGIQGGVVEPGRVRVGDRVEPLR